LKKSRHSDFETSTYTLQCELAKKHLKHMLFRSVLRTEDTPPVVLIGLQAVFMTGHKQRYSLSRDCDVWKFPIIHEYFHV